MSWVGSVLKVLAEGHPYGHLFEFNYTDFLEQFRISREWLVLEGMVAVANETLRAVQRPEQQIPKPTEGSQTRKVAATAVHGTLQKTRELPATVSRYSSGLIACLTVARDHFVDAIWKSRHDQSLPPVRMNARTRYSCFLV